MRFLSFTAVFAVSLLLLISSGYAEQSSSNESPTDLIWNGTWACSNHYFHLEQNPEGITGWYEPKNQNVTDTGLLDGSIDETGMNYSGIWTESGTVNLTLSPDNASYSGIATTNPLGTMTEPAVHTADATRIGDVTDPENLWTGEWETPRKVYTYLQNGSTITGFNTLMPGVMDQPGTFEGTVSEDGRTIIGNWTETGTFNFTMTDGYSAFNATYHETLDPKANSSFMIAKKLT